MPKAGSPQGTSLRQGYAQAGWGGYSWKEESQPVGHMQYVLNTFEGSLNLEPFGSTLWLGGCDDFPHKRQNI